jgi:D-hexose-6-phosphate mutarotase
MEIELFSGSAKAIIDPQGAWLTNLSDEYGDILYPKRTLKTPHGDVKVRGGCHVCLPNFGSGGASGLAQHGFGRSALWEIITQTGDTVQLELPPKDGEYEGLEAALLYTLTPRSLKVELKIKNSGTIDLRVAPAFHPYFAIDKGEKDVKVNHKRRELNELNEAEFVYTAGVATLKSTRRKMPLKIESPELSVFALWTDQLGEYVCVEPTLAGFSFLQSKPAGNEIVAAAESRSFAMTISW